MKTYLADIIPKIQEFNQKLNDLSKLTNQHWILLDDITEIKSVYIFRTNNRLLVSCNGLVEKGQWEYLGNNSLLMETSKGSFLFKQKFGNQNVMALKLDSTNNYVFFVNESKHEKELNNIEDILAFLTNYYMKNNNPIENEYVNSRENDDFYMEQNEWIENPDQCSACGFKEIKNKDECPDCGIYLK